MKQNNFMTFGKSEKETLRVETNHSQLEFLEIKKKYDELFLENENKKLLLETT